MKNAVSVELSIFTSHLVLSSPYVFKYRQTNREKRDETPIGTRNEKKKKIRKHPMQRVRQQQQAANNAKESDNLSV